LDVNVTLPRRNKKIESTWGKTEKEAAETNLIQEIFDLEAWGGRRNLARFANERKSRSTWFLHCSTASDEGNVVPSFIYIYITSEWAQQYSS
jgi:hypothetical protein